MVKLITVPLLVVLGVYAFTFLHSLLFVYPHIYVG